MKALEPKTGGADPHVSVFGFATIVITRSYQSPIECLLHFFNFMPLIFRKQYRCARSKGADYKLTRPNLSVANDGYWFGPVRENRTEC